MADWPIRPISRLIIVNVLLFNHYIIENIFAGGEKMSAKMPLNSFYIFCSEGMYVLCYLYFKSNYIFLSILSEGFPKKFLLTKAVCKKHLIKTRWIKNDP